MKNKYYTSPELSEKLKENGCGLDSEYSWEIKYDCYEVDNSNEEYCENHNYYNKVSNKVIKKTSEIKCLHKERINGDWVIDIKKVLAYDILRDICVRYAKEFFGEKDVCKTCGKSEEEWGKINRCRSCRSADYINKFQFITQKILKMLQQNKPQEEIEDYIWKNCLFNPKNKENR
jgi:hypothetical protein